MGFGIKSLDEIEFGTREHVEILIYYRKFINITFKITCSIDSCDNDYDVFHFSIHSYYSSTTIQKNMCIQIIQ